MANTLEKTVNYLPQVLDAVVAQDSVTGLIPDGTATGAVQSTGIKGEYKVMKIAFGGGLTDYDRANGFTTGSITTEWQTLKAGYDRQQSFQLDAVDAEQAALQIQTVSEQFVHSNVIPELDAYRLAKYAKAVPETNIDSATTYTKGTAVGAISKGLMTIGDAGFPTTGRIIFVSYAFYDLFMQGIADHRLEQGTVANHTVSMYNGNAVVPVSSSRFYSEITLGTGYTKGTSAVGLNFLIVSPEAVVQLVQHNPIRVFTPEVNQKADAYKFDYRIFGDAWVLDNKKTGLYLSKMGA